MYEVTIENSPAISELIKSVLDGEEVIFTENDQPVAKLVRVSKEDDFWIAASFGSLAKIWDNEEDDVYAELLKN